MDSMVKKYKHKFRKLRDEMDQWNHIQSRLLLHFRNASAIIQRLNVLQEPKNYGALNPVDGIREEILGKQMYSLELIFQSIQTTMEEFNGIVVSLEKSLRDGRHLAHGASRQMTESQMQWRVGIQPNVVDCIAGLKAIYEMHRSEYILKLSVISSLVSNDPLPSASDLGTFQQLLMDQPNIPKEEVQSIFDIIFAEEIC